MVGVGSRVHSSTLIVLHRYVGMFRRTRTDSLKTRGTGCATRGLDG